VIATKLPGIMKEFGEGNGVVYIERPEFVLKTAYAMAENGSINRCGNSARMYVHNLDWGNITDSFEHTIKEEL